MRHSLRGLLGLALVSCFANFAAPALASDLISVEAASRAGLTRGWFTQVQINRSNGRLLYITQHVSDVHNQQVFDVVAGTELYRYADRDRDAFGEALGRDGAKARATEKYNELEAQGKKPVVKNYVVPDVTIYAVTDRGLIQAIDGASGQTLWAKTVGNANYPTTNVAANDTHVAVCNGSTIYVLDRRDGTALWQREALGVISAGPAITNTSVSAPMVSGSVETFRTDTQKRYSPYIYRSQGIIYTQPIMTPRNSMAWATERGHMYVAEGSTGKPRFRLEASDTIIGGVAYLLPKYFYVASYDGYVYCLDEVNGSQLWRYSCGSSD
ncbi:MAG TPA: PQQ-binding-like beta-propeller repeat protein, partial [Pirellulaceae bacterium]|nr:PQQ-binding-like beta-propeller repeat protein [Pirellulaceae bacterium]